MATCDLVISNDRTLAHLAAAIGKPIIQVPISLGNLLTELLSLRSKHKTFKAKYTAICACLIDTRDGKMASGCGALVPGSARYPDPIHQAIVTAAQEPDGFSTARSWFSTVA